jgi:hypothetical protein
MKNYASSGAMNNAGECEGVMRPIVNPNNIAWLYSFEHWTKNMSYQRVMKRP